MRAVPFHFLPEKLGVRRRIAGNAARPDARQGSAQQIRHAVRPFRSRQENEHAIPGPDQHADAVGKKIKRALQIIRSKGQTLGYPGRSGSGKGDDAGNFIQWHAEKTSAIPLDIRRLG